MTNKEKQINDTISRQAAIKAFDGEIRIIGEDNYNAVQKYIRNVSEKIRNLPYVQPQRNKGKWILVKGSNGKDYHKCSECLHTQDITGVKNYCPVCGTEMRSELDD